MRIQLPVETWIEILDWLRRRDLIKKLDCLWDREFTPIVQDWLHKYTRSVKIGRLWTESDGLSVVSSEGSEPVPFADVEMPGNVTSFQHINIRYLDTNVLALLRRMRPLFHSEIHLEMNYYFSAPNELSIRTALRHLIPLFGSIDSISFDCKFLQLFSVNYPSSLSNAKLLEICDLKLEMDTCEQLINWLFTPREDGQPRTVLLICEYPAGFWEKLRERFLDPTHQLASPFFILTYNGMTNTSAENLRTGEQLMVNGVDPVLISNLPLNNVDPEWLAKKREEVRKWEVYDQQQAIFLSSPLEIGPLEDADQQNAEEAI